ncbi:unnamed protein product [Rotaria socialis]
MLKQEMLKFGAFLLVILSTSIHQCGSAPTVYTITNQQYGAIQTGWTRAQVTKLVGSPGNVVSQAGTGSTSFMIIEYTGIGAGVSNAIAAIGFIGGAVVSKSEVGFDTTTAGKINIQQYNTIQIGWNQSKVLQLLGGNGNIVSQAGKPGTSSYVVTAQYTGSQSSFAIVSFVFIGGILNRKSQIGLDTGIYTITKQQYTAIQIGWTRAQLTQLVGSSGSVVSEAGTGSTNIVTVYYTGIGTGVSNAIAAIIFIGGAVVAKSEAGFDAAIAGKINIQQYNTIQIGWNQSKVLQLLGGNGNIVSQAGKPGTSSYVVTAQYTGSQSSFAIVSFVFIGGILNRKSQIGLDTGIYTITKQQYTAIEIGWTRAQLTQLVGSSGSVVSEAGTGSTNFITVEYTGTGAGVAKAIAVIVFIGGAVVAKSEAGLDAAIAGKINIQQYNTIQIGWNQSKVLQLLGGNGNIVSQAGKPIKHKDLLLYCRLRA